MKTFHCKEVEKKAPTLKKRLHQMTFDDLSDEKVPEGSEAIRVVPLRQAPSEGTQEFPTTSPKPGASAQVDLTTLILSDDEDESSDRHVVAEPVEEELINLKEQKTPK